MNSLQNILDVIRNEYEDIEVKYLHPSLYVICVSDEFDGMEEETRLARFWREMPLREKEAMEVLAATSTTLCLLTAAERKESYSFLDQTPAGRHWIEYLACGFRRVVASPPQVPILHFYGFKGGQARSTVLAMLAKSLANDGYAVLAVDADIEAPSLNSQFGVRVDRIESTLLGVVQYGYDCSEFAPAYLGAGVAAGRVDLLACRPSDSDCDLDQAVFALRSALDPMWLQRGFSRIVDAAQSYDVLLVDHRSGISSSALPLSAAFPGAVVACVRLDEQSDDAMSYFRIMFSHNPESPGVYVSFSLDPEDSIEKTSHRHAKKIEQLLSILANSIEVGAAGDDSTANAPGAEDLRQYWLSWFHDRAFLAGTATPSVDSIFQGNRNTLVRIRELVGLPTSKKNLDRAVVPTVQVKELRQLTNNGNTDQGLLIQTEALRKLAVPNSPYLYVLGRKGTGKTRMVRALVDRQLGVPILAADEFPNERVIVSSDPILKDLAEGVPRLYGPETFWWILFDSASRAGGESQREVLQGWLARMRGRSTPFSVDSIVERIVRSGQRAVYLIDGVETAFSSSQMSAFVEGLFRFLSSVQSSHALSRQIMIRLFMRTDLVRFAVENVEQQIEGRSLYLSWDTESILNFALSRIRELSWFRESFPDVTADLDNVVGDLELGGLSEEQCNEILLRVFPSKLRRNNLYTLTFLKGYFSEGIDESASFYPRIYDTFLRSIANPSIIKPVARLARLEDGRVAQPLVIAAHEYASKEYLTQVIAELKNLLQLSETTDENQTRVERLIEAFGGMPTPFEVEKCLSDVLKNLRNHFDVDRERLRRAMEQMKRVGIFEERPGYAGWWRAGRLFKNSLRMKYVR